MGGGSYSSSDRTVRATSMGFYDLPKEQIFKSKSINNAMNPHGITVRESRDSDEHPNTVPIIIALDVTGSMGTVPHYLVKDGLPNIMANIIQRGILDPQLLFLAVGDHECGDRAPLQVAQFESSDELLDHWLTNVYLEGGGGGNEGESYLLAWHFAAFHTSTDSYEKRKKKGFLFTIGDEPTLKRLPKSVIEKLIGTGQPSDFTAAELLAKAMETYNVYHLHIKETRSGQRSEVIGNWKQLMSDHLIVIETHEDVPNEITRIISEQADTFVAKKEQKVNKPSSSNEEIL